MENRWRTIKTLVLTPTRELAIQIEENFTEYSTELDIKNMVLFGWVKQGSQVRKLKSWVDILIATPGRLLDLMQQWYIDLRHIEVFILDEADRMLDMWFINDVKKVLKELLVLEIDKDAKPVKKTQNSRNRNRRSGREKGKRPVVENKKRDVRRKKNKR